MSIKTSNHLHQANQKLWEASSKRWAECADSRGIWKNCSQDPTLVFSERVLHYLHDIKENKVGVLGSGDNEAVFALAGMGAQVTSVDISEKQLQVAKKRAKTLGLEITFVQADVTRLSSLASQTFDMLYTGGHVAVWVSDLAAYYSEAARILKPGGILIVDEYHPFRRVWKESKDELIVQNNYYQRGPYRYFQDDDILYSSEGKFESFEFHWTISDFINTIIQASCTIMEVDEHGDAYEDWELAPMKGLPENLLIIAKKNV